MLFLLLLFLLLLFLSVTDPAGRACLALVRDGWYGGAICRTYPAQRVLVLLVVRGWSGVGLGSFLCCFSCCGGQVVVVRHNKPFFLCRCGFRCGGGGAWWCLVVGVFSSGAREVAECGH